MFRIGETPAVRDINSERFENPQAQLQTGNLQQAKVELKEATTADPNLADAALLQAELDIQTGAYQPAIEALETRIAKRLGDGRGYLLLGHAHLAKREQFRS